MALFRAPHKKIEWEEHDGGIQYPKYTIANLQGRENGRSWINMIWGKLFQVNDRPFNGVN